MLHESSGEIVLLPKSVPDPIEPFNRIVYAFNKGLMTGMVKPTAKVYRLIVRKPVRTGSSRTLAKSMNTPIEYTIIAVPFHADAATHDELARKVNEKLRGGYELYGPPFLSEEMMYQAMTKTLASSRP